YLSLLTARIFPSRPHHITFHFIAHSISHTSITLTKLKTLYTAITKM
ncbi:hypothetical protein TSAR_004778, partial [Trichomalopsis sarcophagae]